jgi:VIT1/CCC1 family predicted Fe2+/Mn2+ transporter
LERSLKRRYCVSSRESYGMIRLTNVGAIQRILSGNRRICDTLIKCSPNETSQIIRRHFQQYHISEESSVIIQDNLASSPVALKDFLMKHYFSIAEPPDNRPYISALTLGLAYIFGGIIPLLPYFFLTKVDEALFISIGLMAFVLLVFGYVKTGVVRGWSGRANVLAGIKGSLQMLVVGATAAGAAVGLVRALNRGGDSLR